MTTAKTKQEEVWSGQFGAEYTDRNTYSFEEVEQFYRGLYGVTRTEMNGRFLDGLKPERILEVGCNTGNQLLVLQTNGFRNLYGVELMPYATQIAKKRLPEANIIQGSAFDLPFKDGFFDLVFTSGVLIHISPEDIGKVMTEIYRCSRRYIWGLEYFSENYTEINYRGNHNLLWKTNFATLYREKFPDLKLIKEERFKYLDGDNVDAMFLLEKR